MVRSYLIENRICFDSDPSSGGGGGGKDRGQDRFDKDYLSDENFDQQLQQDIARAQYESKAANATSDGYTYQRDFDPDSPENKALIEATGNILQADRGARDGGRDRNQAIRRAEIRASKDDSVKAAIEKLVPSDPAALNAIKPDLSAPDGFVDYEKFDNALARQKANKQAKKAKKSKPDEAEKNVLSMLLQNNPRNLFNALQNKATQFMMPRISKALTDPSFTPVYGYNNRLTGAANEFGQLIEGTDPTNSLGIDDYGAGESGDNLQSILPPVDDFPSETGAAGAIGQIPSDELALNYLKSPYYGYSGFANLYAPYGYANNTLVDLLQTRGMTQPGQADTLGLFANPRDFT